MHIRKLYTVAVVLMVLLLVGSLAMAQGTAGQNESQNQQTGQGRIDVQDQAVTGNGRMIIDRVFSNGPGWIVLHCVAGNIGSQDTTGLQIGNQPDLGCLPLSTVNNLLGLSDTANGQGTTTIGQDASTDQQLEGRSVIGYAALQNGDNKGLEIPVDTTRATGLVLARVHVDAGALGVFEFPGVDVPALGPNGRTIGVLIDTAADLQAQTAVTDQGDVGDDDGDQEEPGVTPPVTVTVEPTVGLPPGLTPEPGSGLVTTPTPQPTVGATATPPVIGPTSTITTTGQPGSNAGGMTSGTVGGQTGGGVAESTPSTLPVTGRVSAPWSLLFVALGGMVLLGGAGLAIARHS